MTISELTAILPPPSDPVDAGPTSKWREVEQRAGMQLPADLREFALVYGSGCILPLNYLKIANPFADTYVHRREQLLATIRSYFGDDPEMPDPFPLFPEPGGLLPWGRENNGNVFAWITEGPPDQWETVLLLHGGHEDPYSTFNVPLIRLLIDALNFESAIPIFERNDTPFEFLPGPQ